MDTHSSTSRNSPIILIVLMVIIIAAFLLLDFRLIQGKANASSQVSTYAFSIDKGTQLSIHQPLDVYVIGNTEIGHTLAEALSETLTGIPGVSTIEFHDGTPELSEDSVLVVDVQQSDMTWTPFYSQTDVKMQVAYASDGEVEWIDEQTVELTNGKPVVRVRGDYEMDASARGLMSLPGYRSYLAESLAEQIASSLTERLFNPNP
jgi:hypothetical protein